MINIRHTLSLLLCLAAAPALAQGVDCDRPHNQTLSEATFRVVERASQELGDDKAGQAEARLEALLGRVRGYERAVVLQTLGYAYISQNRDAAALRVFREALELDVLPVQPQQQLLYNTAQLLISGGDSAAGVALLERYLREACEAPPAEAHMLLAVAYTEQRNYRPALTQVDLALGKLREPRESWLQLKMGLHYELREWPRVAEVLVRLINLAPSKPDYWNQLSGVFFELRRQQEALAVLALAERQGFFDTARQYRNLSDVYRMLEIPYKAGQVYDSAMSRGIVPRDAATLEYLADNWIMAREWDRAETTMLAAAERASGGRLWQRLGQVYMEQDRWQDAVSALTRAIANGVDDSHAAHYFLGVAAFNAGDATRAQEALRVATRGGRHQAAARQWLEHVRMESGG
jgi:tetratricopeptide (TPR) repeat protein